MAGAVGSSAARLPTAKLAKKPVLAATKQQASFLNEIVLNFMRDVCASENCGGGFLPHYFGTVNATENCVLSHDSFNIPPPSGFFATPIVNWSTGLSNAVFVKST